MGDETLNQSQLLRALDLGSVENLVESSIKTRRGVIWIEFNNGLSLRGELVRGVPRITISRMIVGKEYWVEMEKEEPSWRPNMAEKWGVKSDLSFTPELQEELLKVAEDCKCREEDLDFASAVSFPKGPGMVGYLRLALMPANRLYLSQIPIGRNGNAGIIDAAPQTMDFMIKSGLATTPGGLSPNIAPFLERGYPRGNELCRRLLEQNAIPIKKSHSLAMKEIGIDPKSFNPSKYVGETLQSSRK